MLSTNDATFARWIGQPLGYVHHHFRRWMYAYFVVIAAFGWFAPRYTVGFNLSNSLPYSVVLIDKQSTPVLGDLVAFHWWREKFYRPELWFVKRVAGVAGQHVTVRDRYVFVDGVQVGWAKPNSEKGEPLEPIAEGVIPEGHFYAATEHPDSLDSRYAITGLVDASRVIGVAHVVF